MPEASPHTLRISWPSSEGMSPLQARLWDVVQHVGGEAIAKAPQSVVRGLPVALRMLSLASPKIPASVQDGVQLLAQGIASTPDEKLRSGLEVIGLLISQILQDEEEATTPNGSDTDTADTDNTAA